MSVNQQSEDAQASSLVTLRSKITIKLTENGEIPGAPQRKITVKLPELQEIISEEVHDTINETTIPRPPDSPSVAAAPAFAVPDLLPDDILSLLKTELLPQLEEKKLAIEELLTLDDTANDDLTLRTLSTMLLDDELTKPMVPDWHTELQALVTSPLKVAEY